MKSLLKLSARILWAGLFAVLPTVVTAEDAPAKLSAEDLIEQLDAEEYDDRQEAGRKLAELGKAALPALEKGVAHVSREVVFRSFDLLKRLQNSSDPPTKTAAVETLQRLAKSDDARLAKQAKEILEPAKDTPEPQQIFPIVPIAPAARLIRVHAAIGGGRRVTVKNVNGVRDIEADEDGRKIKIHDDPEKGIEVEITQKKDGKEETKKYEAKDADELKTKHPEANEVFEKYGKQGGEIKLEFGGIALPAPLEVPAVPVDPIEIRKRQIEVLERSIQTLDRSIDRLQEQKKQMQEKKAALEAEEAKR